MQPFEKHNPEFKHYLRNHSAQSSYITDHMKTLMRVGYAVRTPSIRTSSASQTENRKVFSEFKGIVKHKTISHHWRSNIHGHKSTNSSRKNSVNIPYENVQSNFSIDQQFKNSQSKLNMISYNIYNSPIMGQSKFNERKIRNRTRSVLHKRGSFKSYCEQSTIHGLKYIGDCSLPKLERIFWMISVALALCGAASFIWHLYFKFTTSPIIISRNPTNVPIDQIPFPALTICNMNNVKKSFAAQVIRKNDEVQTFLLNDICNAENNTAIEPDRVKNKEAEKTFINEFLLKASQSCKEMLYHCQWNGNEVNCTDIFNPVYTDEGICCNFNSVKRIFWQARTWHGLNVSYASDDHVDWNPEYMFKKTDPASAIPWRGHGSGSSHGLTIALDVNVDEYYCSSTVSVGFKMLLHSPVETPQMREYAFTLSPGKETRVIITPHINDADSAIMKISPKIRKCYFLHERRLRYYKTYTQRNCQLECEANSTLKWCNCMQYYMPVEVNMQICDQTNDECVNKVKRQMWDSFEQDEDYENDTALVHGCNCYPGCHDIDYSTEISQSTLVSTFEVGNKYFKKNSVYFEKNIAIVHVFYIDSSYTKYTKSELYGFAEMLSNTGGLLGLFMGFSLLSVTEIVYYILLWIWKVVHEKRKKKNRRMLAKKRDVVYPFAQ